MASKVFDYFLMSVRSTVFFVLLCSSSAFASNELAQTFTLDGQLMIAGTTTVLADAAAVLKIDILDPTKSCVLYEEQQTVNTVSSDGYFSVQVGSVTGAAKRTSSDPGLTMAQIFQNTSAVAATSASGATCSGNTYTPMANAVRYFRITVTPSSTNVADVLSPDTTIDAAPMAMVAQSLQGYAATDFLAKAGLPTCSSGTFLTYDGTNMTCAAVSGSSGGTVTSITAGTGLTGGTITASGTIALATSGATAGTYGSASAVPVVTVDGYGRVTNVTTASISGAPTGAASGDLSGTYPGPTVSGLNGTALSISSLTSGQYLKYNGTNWINSTLSVNDSNITYASEAANTFFAAPNGSAGTPTFRAMVAADLPTVPYTRGGTGLTATPANGQIAIGNGSGYTLGTLTAGSGVTITNTAGAVTIAAAGSGGTVTSVTGTAPISVATGTSTPVVSISQATTSTAGYLSSADWNTFNSKMGSSLASGDIFVGNASGGAVPVAMSGDATLSNAGVLTLASVATAGTYEKVVVNAKGLVTSGSSLGSSDITTALGYTPVNKAGDSMTGNLTFASGDGTIYTAGNANTITVEAPSSVTTSYVLKLPAAVASSAGQVLTSDTSGNLSWSTPSTTATSYSGVLPIANGGTNSSTALNNNRIMVSSGGSIVESSALTNGQLLIGSTGAAPAAATLTAGSGITITNAANSITIAASGSSMPALPSADIFVGNSSGGAAAVAMTGDIGITNAGATTVNKIQGTAVSSTTPTAGQVLRYTSGTGWVPDFVSMADLRSTITGATALTSCGANQTLTWTAAADNLTCTSIAISDSQITYGSEAANTVLAAPNGSAGAPTYRALVAADLPTVPYTRGGTGLTATPANGQIPIGNGSGYTLGTLTAGSGVTITNTAGVISIAATTGGGGTVTSVTGTAPISVATGTTTPAITISQATTSTDGYLSSTDWNTFNSKLGSSLASGDIFVGNSSGGAVPVAVSGDATLSNAGVLTLASVATAGTYEKVVVNAKGLVTSGSSLGSSDITTALGYTPVNKAGDSMSGNLTHAASTGDIYTAGSGSNTVTVEGPSGAIGTSYVLRLPTSVASVAGQVLTSDTSGNLSWTTPSTTATSYSGVLPIANGGTNSSTTLNNNRIMVSSGGSIVEAGALTNGQLLIGSTGAAPAAATLTAGSGVTITNAAGGITIAATGSGGTVTSVTGTAPISVATGTTTPAISISQANTSTSGYLSSTDWNTFNSKLTSSLASGDVFVGNSSGGAVPVAVSGDATLSNAGVLTLASVATAGTYEKVVVNAKGLVTSGSSLGSSDITTALGYTPVNKAGDSMSGNLTFASGDGTVYTAANSNTVTIEAPSSVTTSYVLKLPAAVASVAGQMLTSDTSGNLSWTTATTGTVTSVGLSLPSIFTVTNSPVTSSGTLTATLASETANTFLAAPNGSAGTPTFRTIASADLPTIPVSGGGTGLTAGTSGGIPYYASTSTMASSALLTQYGVVYGGGSGTAPAATAAGTSGYVLTSNGGSSAPSFQQVSLSAGVTGTLPIANGGTSATTASAARTALGAAASGANGDITSTSVLTSISSSTSAISIAPTGNLNLSPSTAVVSSAVIETPLGTAAAPSHTNSTNPNTGMYFPTSTSLGFSTNGASAMTILSSGYVGIGVTSPSFELTNSAQINVTDQGNEGLAGAPTTFLWEHPASSTVQGYEAAFLNSYSATNADGLLVRTTDTTSGSKIFTVDSGGIDRVNVLGNGYVGIGSTAPSTTVDTSGGEIRVQGGASYGNIASVGQGLELAYDTTAGQGLVLSYNRSASSYKTLRMEGSPLLINAVSSGVVGIGTTSPEGLFDVYNGGFGTLTLHANMDPSGFTPATVWGTTTSNSQGLAIGINRSAGARETNFVNVTPGYTPGGFTWDTWSGSTYTNRMKLDSNGNLTLYGCVVYNGGTAGTCNSDRRLKKDIRPFELGLNQVLGLQPVFYKYNGLGGMDPDSKDRIGVIAQDVEKVAPQIVETRQGKLYRDDKKDSTIKVVNYNAFTYMVINAIKEFYHEFTDTKADVVHLQRDVASLKAENEQLKQKEEQTRKENEEIKARLDKLEKALNSK